MSEEFPELDEADEAYLKEEDRPQPPSVSHGDLDEEVADETDAYFDDEPSDDDEPDEPFDSEGVKEDG